ncbi:winged helix-turn-helix domain-containing protein [Candidatus Parcubacteria bacterium]|nr:winged helix-turn-helix domain-containing protein [Candidatus Parcubacteria bacterium]
MNGPVERRPETVVVGRVILSNLKRRVWIEDFEGQLRPVKLISVQYSLLRYLAERGKTTAREEIQNSVWRGQTHSPNIVPLHISRIRKALNKALPGSAKYIRTVKGVGYEVAVPG